MTAGGALPSSRLMEMCRWMGSHFHYWIDYNGVAFSLKFLEHVEWGHKEGVRKKVTKKSAKSD